MSHKKSLIIFYWLLFGLAFPNVILSITEDLDFWARLTNILLPTGILGILATLSRNLVKSIWLLLPFAFLGSFQLVLLGLYGSGIISVDMFLNLVTTNSVEVRELLGNLIPMIISVVVIYGVPLGYAIYHLRRKTLLPVPFIKHHRKILFLITSAGLITLPISYLTSKSYSIRNDLYPANVIYNIYLAIDRTVKSASQDRLSSTFLYRSKPSHDPEERELYIVVVGETSRAASWQLFGYSRATNPLLSLRSDLCLFPDAYSESNTTHKSVPMLLSPVSSVDFDSGIYQVKSLISAFKEAGFSTAFLSNQQPNHSFIDYFAFEADTTLFVREKMTEEHIFNDSLLLPHLEAIISEMNKKQLIVLHTYGSHFNYLDRYMPEDATFLPDRFANADIKYRVELVNAYDNTIIQTDRFLDAVISILKTQDCVAALTYTSDHGEDIYENGKSFLHASPKPSDMQLHVPMLIWFSQHYLSEYPETASVLYSNREKPLSTSRSFCPTSISIAGISSPEIKDDSDLFSTGYKPTERVYLNDHNRPIPLSVLIR